MILHVIDSLDAGGAERVLVTIVNGLAKLGQPVGVCITRSSMEMRDQLPDAVPLLVLNRGSRWDLPPLFRFRKWCADRGVKVIHAHGRSSTMFAATALALRLTDAKLVFHDHFGRIAIDRSVSPALRIANQLFVDRYICVSPELVSWAENALGLHPSEAILVPNSVNLSLWRPQRPPEQSRVHAVLTANLRPEKDHMMIFEAIAGSELLRERLLLICAGGGSHSPYGQSLVSAVTDQGLGRAVEIIGVTGDMESLLASAHFGVVASKSEAGPIASLEYMAMALPFVTTRTGQVASFAEAAGACLTVAPQDVQGMRVALESMVAKSSDERVAMGARGRALVAEHFDIDRQLALLTSLYRELT